MTPGTSIPLEQFYIARPADTAATMNAQLAKGKNLILPPSIYDLTEPIRVTRPDTVVLGLGLATLRPTHGTAAMTTADVDGIEISGLLFDAGTESSPTLLEVGSDKNKMRHANNPITLHDVFFRVGGAGVGAQRPTCLSTATMLLSTTPGSGGQTMATVWDGAAIQVPTGLWSTATT
jgi:hypothetical protein